MKAPGHLTLSVIPEIASAIVKLNYGPTSGCTEDLPRIRRFFLHRSVVL